MSRTPSRARVLLTALSAATGGGLAWWRWGGPWLAGLALLTGGLLLLAVFAPRAYAPVFTVLDGVVRGALQALTWMLLGIVFVLIFMPGRVVLAARRRDPLDRVPTRTRASAWHRVAVTKNAAESFRTQF